jgi:hypothetical protein
VAFGAAAAAEFALAFVAAAGRAAGAAHATAAASELALAFVAVADRAAGALASP